MGKEESLCSLVKNLERDVSIIKEPLPSWDLSVVLRILSRPPFEPMGLAELDKVTFKTVFLVTLAACARRSEIHAIRVDQLKWKEDGTVLLAGVDPKFLAKTQVVEGPRTVGKPIVIKALSRIIGRQEEERLLCPVRAVKFYLQRVKDFRRNRRKLFISYQKNHQGEIVKGTISGWIKRTVVLAYKLAEKDAELRQLHRIGAHDLRRFGASWAFERNVGLENIMASCRWRNHNTFTTFYLKDLAYMRDGLLELGPISVASALV